MKHLKDISYPKDFVNPKAAIVDEGGTNKLIQSLNIQDNWCISTGDTLVLLDSTAFISVYKLVGQSKVDVIEGLV